MEFKIGDVVRLKSGGAYMVISNIAKPSGEFVCEWHNKGADGYTHVQHTYPAAALIKATAEQVQWIQSGN